LVGWFVLGLGWLDVKRLDIWLGSGFGVETYI
jgi:hypothetical protein